ncbi:MAG: hydantoinase B/oxoprolinase family protein, partial [Candidatus Xenobia bacterium]
MKPPARVLDAGRFAEGRGVPVTPFSLEIFRHLWSGIAEEMGAALVRTAFSPNIKERRDFSCALFDGAGRLVAQAAHIPVHLGSMPALIEHVLAHHD